MACELHAASLPQSFQIASNFRLARRERFPARGMRNDIMAKRLEVFVVDDQTDLAETTGSLLRLHGHRVSVFYSGRAVLDALEHQKPDLIIADIRMPEMNGCELASTVRRRPGCENVILAALTGFGDDESRKAAIDAGFDFRFVKPMHPEDLQHFLEEIARRGGRR